MKNLVTIVCILSIITACNKSKPYTYPIPAYQYFDKSNLTHFSSFKLYTNTGEITDALLINKYKQEWKDYFYDVNTVFNAQEFNRFLLLNDDSIINVSVTPTAELKRTAIDEYDKFSGNQWIPVNDTNNLMLHISKYKIHKLKTTPANYSYYDVESPVYFLKKVNDTLFVPIVNFVVISRYDYTLKFSSDKFNNVFSPGGINKLGAKDTLLIQSFDVAMKKVK